MFRLRFAAAFLCALAVTPAFADDVYARIRGTVTDPTGAAVPKATIVALNNDTKVARELSSASDGSFEFLNLAVGTYDVTVRVPAFRTFVAKAVTLSLNQTYVLTAALEVGSVQEVVQVEGNPAQVELSNTQLGTVIESRQIVDLPLLARNWVQLQQLAPGVVASSDRFPLNFATNGNQSQQNSFLINGTDSNDLPLNNPLVIPSPDAIGEFNLVTNVMNAEFGRNSGAVLNAIIKNGTNQFHGNAFDFYRDTFLNTRSFFQTQASIFHQHQFGGTFGGPVRRDRTFFFLSYQGIRARQPQAGGLTTVFTPDERNGFFPDLAASTGTSPFPLRGENGAIYAAGTPYRTIFPTGHIPTSDFNSISASLVSKYVPLPNLGSNQYSFNPLTVTSTDQGIARADHTFSPRDAIWFVSVISAAPAVNTLSFLGGTVPGFGDQSTADVKQFTEGWNHTFSPSMLNEFRLGYTRFNFVSVLPQTIVQPSSMGFDIQPQQPQYASVPLMGVTGYFTLGFSSNGPQPRIDQTFQLTDNFSVIRGKHALKFGFDGRRFQVFNPFLAQNNGAYAFGGSGTYSTGQPGADFLLGIPDSYGQQSGGTIDVRAYESYLYAQDSWHVRSNLTLNYGVGWQVDTPLDNRQYDRIAKNCFRPGEQSTVFPTAPKGLVFPGDPGCSTSGYYSSYKHFGPRFGFAWSPDLGWLSGGASGRLSIRGGYGVFFNRSEEELALQDLGAVPFAIGSGGIADVGGSPSFARPFVDISTGRSMPSKFPFTPAAKGDKTLDFSQFFPLVLNVISPDFSAPYAQNFHLTVQRQLGRSTILTAGYVGSLGRRLIMAYEVNPITLAGAAACAADPKCTSGRTIQHFLYPSHSALPGDVFASVGQQSTPGTSNFNSFQFSLERRLNHGLQFTAAYTHGHALDDASGFENSSFGARGTNPYNFRANYGDSAFDARHRLVTNYIYLLPSLSRGRVLKYVVNGWQIAGITTFQTGFPITLADTGFRSLTCDSLTYYGCPDAPDVLGPVHTDLDPRNSSFVNTTRSAANKSALGTYWFDPNNFQRAPFGVLGNAGRNFFHGPGIVNTDFVLSKHIPIRERDAIELRLEAFNVFNHTQFGNPNGDINSANFGRISTTVNGSRRVQLAAKIRF